MKLIIVILVTSVVSAAAQQSPAVATAVERDLLRDGVSLNKRGMKLRVSPSVSGVTVELLDRSGQNVLSSERLPHTPANDAALVASVTIVVSSMLSQQSATNPWRPSFSPQVLQRLAPGNSVTLIEAGPTNHDSFLAAAALREALVARGAIVVTGTPTVSTLAPDDAILATTQLSTPHALTVRTFAGTPKRAVVSLYSGHKFVRTIVVYQGNSVPVGAPPVDQPPAHMPRVTAERESRLSIAGGIVLDKDELEQGNPPMVLTARLAREWISGGLRWGYGIRPSFSHHEDNSETVNSIGADIDGRVGVAGDRFRPWIGAFAGAVFVWGSHGTENSVFPIFGGSAGVDIRTGDSSTIGPRVDLFGFYLPVAQLSYSVNY